MNISVSQSAELTADNITSHVYDDAESGAYIELGTGLTGRQSILIWVGRGEANLSEEARALRKLAEIACDLAAGLEARTAAVAS
jgi:hypothetical protein